MDSSKLDTKNMFPWADYVPIFSQIKSLGQMIKGDKEGAKATQENFIGMFANVIDPNLIVKPCLSHYCSKKRCGLTNQNWMSGLDDSSLITHTTIPGTHDSGCRVGGEFAKCQSWSIREQLKAGIRFFDIRLRCVKNKLYVFHGIINCHLKFEKVVKDCEEFLSKNPSEFIVMRIRKEANNIYGSKPFNEVYKEYAARDVFLKTPSEKVTVKETRGKIFVLKNFPGDGFETEWSFFDSDTQDNFEPISLYAKFRDIYDHHKNAKQHDSKFYVNFLSACTPSLNAWPRKFARRCNMMFLNLLKDPQHQHFAGIVVMDFPGVDLIKELICLNNLKTPCERKQNQEQEQGSRQLPIN